MNKGIKLGYCRISKLRTKFFFQKDGKELEFYIDRDPVTSSASIYLNPGAISGTSQLLIALMAEWGRAKAEEK